MVALSKCNKINKFKAKDESDIKVGYSNGAKAYGLYDEANNRIVELHDVIFKKTILPR